MPTMITRSIVPSLDFIITINGSEYTIANVEEDEKLMFLTGFAIQQINENQDFIWPSQVKIVRNNNYVHSIWGVNQKEEMFTPVIQIYCNENWTLTFSNYDTNTKIHVFGQVLEPQGLHMNY